MKQYTINHDLREIWGELHDIIEKISSLEEKVKNAKLYPQLLNNETFCEI